MSNPNAFVSSPIVPVLVPSVPLVLVLYNRVRVCATLLQFNEAPESFVAFLLLLTIAGAYLAIVDPCVPATWAGEPLSIAGGI